MYNVYGEQHKNEAKRLKLIIIIRAKLEER